MKLRELKHSIPALLRSGVALHIKSAPGIGKSEFMDQTQKAMEKRLAKPYGMAKFFVATASPTDMLGFMMPGEYKGPDGRTHKIAQFTEPLWMTTECGRRLEEFEFGTLVLEEFGQGEPEVKRASAELFLNRRIGPWKLPPGWNVVALSNRSQDRSGVTKDYDFRINRETQIQIEADLQSWEEWALEHRVHPMFIAFANQYPQTVFEGKVPEEQGPWCTPRSLMMLERQFRALGEETNAGRDGMPLFTKDEGGRSKTDPVAMEAARGTIGEAAAAQLASMALLAQEMPKYADIVANPMTAKLPKAERPDAQMLVCYQLAHRVEEADLDAVIKYVERMPAEFTITFGKSACRRNPDLVNTKAFGDWTRRNASLMMAIT